jgi:hypothetical protein
MNHIQKKRSMEHITNRIDADVAADVANINGRAACATVAVRATTSETIETYINILVMEFWDA